MTKIRVADYVADFLVKKGITDIFLVAGGGIMFLTDAVGKNKKLNYYSTHHEQTCACAAESWARITNKPGACLVTTGPGATNALTGVAGAWMDSIPMIVISGQVRTDIIADYTKHRQIGPQEGNTVPTVEHNTKYAQLITKPEDIVFELEKAHYIATSGRPGPVWLDIPLDIQRAEIDIRKSKKFTLKKIVDSKNKELLSQQVGKVIGLLSSARRPILILGGGVSLAGARELVLPFIEKINAPVVMPFSGMDLVHESHRLCMGKFGPVGQRRGNFALQNSDLMISIGSGMSLAAIGFNFQEVAPRAKKVMVNIDPGELNKPTISTDLKIIADAKDFINEMLNQTKNIDFIHNPKWKQVCLDWKKNYPNIIDDFYTKDFVNTYIFFDRLSNLLNSDDTVVTGNSLDAVSMFQALKVKKGQRAFTNANWGSMGWCLPGSIGAAVASKHRTILVTGDGSIQFNIQELGTISHYKLPVKIFVVNNQGYESIRTTQESHFKSNYVGSNTQTGVSNPDFKALAKAYALPYFFIKNNDQIKKITKQALLLKGPVLVELRVDPNQHRVPKVSSYKRSDGTLESRPLEDMAPFLPKEEILYNMHLFDKDN